MAFSNVSMACWLRRSTTGAGFLAGMGGPLLSKAAGGAARRKPGRGAGCEAGARGGGGGGADGRTEAGGSRAKKAGGGGGGHRAEREGAGPDRMTVLTRPG